MMTMEIYSGHGLLEPLRVNYSARHDANGNTLGVYFLSKIIAC